MTIAVRRFALVLAAVVLAACTLDKPGWVDQKQANDAEANFYTEQVWDGRLYAFGTSTNYKAFQVTHDLQFAKTFIGAGPKGETVRLELDPKNDALLRRVREEYEVAARRDQRVAPARGFRPARPRRRGPRRPAAAPATSRSGRRSRARRSAVP